MAEVDGPQLPKLIGVEGRHDRVARIESDHDPTTLIESRRISDQPPGKSAHLHRGGLSSDSVDPMKPERFRCHPAALERPVEGLRSLAVVEEEGEVAIEDGVPSVSLARPRSITNPLLSLMEDPVDKIHREE